MKWSNHAYTRHGPFLPRGEREIAKGYISQALDVLSGNSTFTIPEGITPEAAKAIGEEIVAKARRILANVRRS